MAADVDATARLEDALGEPIPDSARPALVALATDLLELRADLEAGLADRAAVVRWHQRLAVAALGRGSRDYYRRVGRAMWPRETGEERVLLACLLSANVRQRAIDPARACEVRRRLAAAYLLPAYHRAVRSLRKSAGEYVGSGDATDDADPVGQRYTAMRPALDELAAWQELALARLLDGGLADRAAVLDWATPLEVATQGELSSAWTRRCYREPSTRRVLVGGPEYAVARAAVAAHHLLPPMARAAADLADRAGEEPALDVAPTEAKPT